MEATVVSVAKSVLNGAVGVAKSAIADEVALELGVQTDLVFINDEFEMMQSFLMAADEDRAKKAVVKTWVKQVRDLGYDTEDCLQDFGVHLKNKPSWWCFPRTMRARHRIANEIKGLKARVEDVSQRNLRYRLIEDSTSKPATATELSSISYAAIYGTDEPRNTAAEKDEPKVDLCQLITTDDKALRVISVWGGASDDLKKMSIIREVCGNQEINTKFGCQAWVKLMNPFDQNDFLRCLVRQFYWNSLRENGKAEEGTAIGVGVLKKMETVAADGHLIDEFDRYVTENKYLIVIDGLSTIVEWDWIKTCFPDRKNGSRIIVSAEQLEIARLCTGQPNQVSKLDRLSSGQPLYLFYDKPESSSNNGTTANSIEPVATDDIVEEDQSMSMGGTNSPSPSPEKDSKSASGKSLARNGTMQAESQLVGREAAMSQVIELIRKEGEHSHVISVWGMGGIGKTTLVRSVYRSEQLSGMFQKRAWVTIMHPFSPGEFFRSLAMRLHTDGSSVGDDLQKRLSAMGLGDLRNYTYKLLEGQKYLIVLDDVSSNIEWDLIVPHLPEEKRASRIIITTREASVARRCSMEYKLGSLGRAAALDLFKKKVFRGTEKDDLTDTMMKQAELILKKCDGLPLAIATIGGFLATKPKTPLEWKKLNDHISEELHNNPELETIKTVLMSSYDGLPYHLKSCFLYLSIFPEDFMIRPGRLVRRWIAEGYSRQLRGKTVDEVAEEYLTDIINRSMIQQTEAVMEGRIRGRYPKITDFHQVHDLMRDISISKSEEENLVFVLDENCTLQPKDKIRHLVVSHGWSRDQKKNVLASIMDVSHIRSLTVFGEWRSFFITKEMRLLRVLDLEDTKGLWDHHLAPIGKLRHLKYLSLRGSECIFHLPDSFGNLSELETLDIRGTCVITLPASVVKLSKLSYLRAGLVFGVEPGEHYHGSIGSALVEIYNAAYGRYVQRYSTGDYDELSDACFEAVILLRGWDEFGVKVPRGIGSLKVLHTLGVVNIARGKAMLKELKNLTQLRKLGVTGINKKNCKELCSAIANHGRLRSLLMRAEGKSGLEGCLDDLSSPPNDLQSLKLFGKLVKVPTWIQQLQMLAKLNLYYTQLERDAIIVLGKLPNLSILGLLPKSLAWEEEDIHFNPGTFTSLTVLELYRPFGWVTLKSVKFEKEAMAKLEVLRLRSLVSSDADGVSGIDLLASLKEVSIIDRLDKKIEGKVAGASGQEPEQTKPQDVGRLDEAFNSNPSCKRMPATDSSSSSPAAHTSFRHDQIHFPPPPADHNTNSDHEIEAFQRHAADLLLDLLPDSSPAAPEILPLACTRHLLDSFLICLEESHSVLFGFGGPPSRAPRSTAPSRRSTSATPSATVSTSSASGASTSPSPPPRSPRQTRRSGRARSAAPARRSPTSPSSCSTTGNRSFGRGNEEGWGRGHHRRSSSSGSSGSGSGSHFRDNTLDCLSRAHNTE